MASRRVPRSLRLYRKGRVLALGSWSQVRKHSLTVADPQPSADTRPLPKPQGAGNPAPQVSSLGLFSRLLKRLATRRSVLPVAPSLRFSGSPSIASLPDHLEV